MRTNRTTAIRPLTRLAAVGAVVGSASLLLVGALQVQAGAAGSAPYNTTTVVTAAPTTVYTGQSVTLTAKLGSSGHGVPGGTVTFAVVGADSSVANCDGGSDAIAVAAGAAVCTISGGLVAGSGPYAVTASYADTADSNYNPSSGTKSVTVRAGKTTTSVTSAVNPSVTGQAVSFQAAVAPVAPAAGAPSGAVTFSGVTCDGGSNTIAVSGGLAQCVIAGGLAAQSTQIIVSGAYSGDSGFAASSGTVKQTAAQAGATVALAADPNNCVGAVCTVGQGTPVSFTGTVASTGTDGGTGVPTGNLVFTIVKAGTKTGLTCDGGSNTIALAGGQATCSVANGLAASVYFTVKVTLVSPGYSAPSATMYENSALAGTNTTIDPSTLHGLGAGQSFTVDATVTPVGYGGSNSPTGYVNVLVCGNNSNGNNGCQGGVAPVVAGVAKFLVGGGEYPGAYAVAAIYTGDANFYSSTARTRTAFVDKSTTQLNLNQYGGFVTISGQAAVITATVLAPDGAAGSVLIGPMSGNITFTVTDPGGNPVTCADGNVVPLAISPGQVEGTATCVLPPGTLTTTSPTGSTYAIHANYGGDSDYTVSNAAVNEAVVPAVA
jgi:hypothetical protein